MAIKPLTTGERTSFALDKVLGASKWMVISATVTFFLEELLEIVAKFNLPEWATLLMYLVINTLIFGIGKFMEGRDS